MEFEEIIRFAQPLDDSKESVGRLYACLLDHFNLQKPEERNFQKNGVLITFDGHSGAGKDTQIALLKEHMQKTPDYSKYNIFEFVQKRNDPFRNVVKYLWQHPEIKSTTDCSLLFLTAGRRYFVYHDLLPSLEDRQTAVILNRSNLSHIAYHASNTNQLADLIALSDFDPDQDLAFVLECDVNLAYSRVVERSPQKAGRIYANEKPDYIERVKRNFKGLATLVNGLIFIDTSRELKLVAQQINQKVDNYFEERK